MLNIDEIKETTDVALQNEMQQVNEQIATLVDDDTKLSDDIKNLGNKMYQTGFKVESHEYTAGTGNKYIHNYLTFDGKIFELSPHNRDLEYFHSAKNVLYLLLDSTKLGDRFREKVQSILTMYEERNNNRNNVHKTISKQNSNRRKMHETYSYRKRLNNEIVKRRKEIGG